MSKTNLGGRKAAGRAPKQRDRYFIKVKRSPLEEPQRGVTARSALVEVDRDTYLAFYQMARALKTLEEKDRRHRVVSIEALPRACGSPCDWSQPMAHAWDGCSEGQTPRKHAELDALYDAIDSLNEEQRALVMAYLERADEIVHSKSPRRMVSIRAIAPIAGVERHRAGKVLKSALAQMAEDITAAMDEFDAALEDDAASAFADSAQRRW